MTLHGGPYNKRRIADSGTVRVRMGIASEWHGNRPSPGARSGAAIYEPTPDRTAAHWLQNEWDGKTAAIIDP